MTTVRKPTKLWLVGIAISLLLVTKDCWPFWSEILKAIQEFSAASKPSAPRSIRPSRGTASAEEALLGAEEVQISKLVEEYLPSLKRKFDGRFVIPPLNNLESATPAVKATYTRAEKAVENEVELIRRTPDGQFVSLSQDDLPAFVLERKRQTDAMSDVVATTHYDNTVDKGAAISKDLEQIKDHRVLFYRMSVLLDDSKKPNQLVTGEDIKAGIKKLASLDDISSKRSVGNVLNQGTTTIADVENIDISEIQDKTIIEVHLKKKPDEKESASAIIGRADLNLIIQRLDL